MPCTKPQDYSTTMPSPTASTSTPSRSSAPARLHLSGGNHALPLHDIAATRAIEHHHMAVLPPHALMQRAGLAVARVALAIAPHAQTVWIACGPGNNGGDGLQAAARLRSHGKRVLVTLLAEADALPDDAQAAHAQALAAGVLFVEGAPMLHAGDLCIDALLGIGASRAPGMEMQACIAAMRSAPCPTLSVDLPTGLQADNGYWLDSAASCVHADHTVTLLSLKPGLFTSHGRDASGQIWWDGLDTCPDNRPATAGATAWLQGASLRAASLPPSTTHLPHASHKGSFGDVCIVGGATGMTGAAWLAGSAALHAGAGRVYIGHLGPAIASAWTELMPRQLSGAQGLAQLPVAHATTACGCGGGDAIGELLPPLLRDCPRLVIDADGLNAIAADATLQEQLRARADRSQHTVLTPHPLEAARLLGLHATAVQADRLAAAHALASRFASVVVLKGSGTVCASPSDKVPKVHFVGNAFLATAGTGDVLAGCLAACWAQAHQMAIAGETPAEIAWHAANAAIQMHGLVANNWHGNETLTASRLAAALPRYQP